MTFKIDPQKSYFIPLGGMEEIGGNCYLYGVGGKWLLVDCGVNFASLRHPGVDFVLPDVSWIAKRRGDLAGMFITHGHEDHIGAIALLWEQLECPIYATPFAAALIEEKFTERKIKGAPLHIVTPDRDLSIGPFELTLINMAHSIPETQGFFLATPQGKIFHTADWKLDPTPVVGETTDAKKIQQQAGKSGVLALIADSTNATDDGPAVSEKDVLAGLVRAFKKCDQAVAVTCFSSNIARLQIILKAAHEVERDVCLIGRSLKRYLDIATDLGYLKNLPRFVPEEEASQVPRRRILYICTGCQGEHRAALPKIARKEYRTVRLQAGDTVIFSAMAIPGNELEIGYVKNLLSAQGVHVLDTSNTEGIHVSGHPYRPELRLMMEWTKPATVIPMHGEIVHMKAHEALAQKEGIKKTLHCRNGSIVEFSAKGAQIIGDLDLKPRVWQEEGDLTFDADGEAMRERRKLAYHGAAVITVLQREDETFAQNVSVSLFGLCDSVDDQKDLTLDIEDAVLHTLATLSRKDLRQREKIIDRLRVAVRQELKTLTGRKPLLDVRLLAID